jgi:catechol 2,3-dioxygenase-like lactoylglutathione lyase family enzyme
MLTNSSVAAILPVTDMDRARKFYEESLGLKPSGKDIGPDHVMYECGGGTKLVIYKREQTKADHTAAGFWVADIEKEMGELRSKGVTFEEYDFPGLKTVNGVATIGPTKSAWFKDTEGNILAISQTV